MFVTSRRDRSTGLARRSGIRLRKVIPRIWWLLVKRFCWRMGQKYVIRDFHPLVFFYMSGFVTWFVGFGLAVYTVVVHFTGGHPKPGTATLAAMFLTFGVLFTLFAMWFDMENNKELR